MLPAGVTYVSHQVDGDYTPGTGIWNVGTIPLGGFASLNITATVDSLTAGTIINTASVTAVDQADTNSANDSDSAQITVPLVCGLTPTGAFTFGTINLDDVLTQAQNTVAQPTIQNTGNGQASVSVGVGDDTAGGGYAGTTDGITHIAASSIQVDVGEGLVPMVSATNTPVGTVNSATTDNIDVQVTVLGVNLPTADPNWSATYTFTSTNCS